MLYSQFSAVTADGQNLQKSQKVNKYIVEKVPDYAIIYIYEIMQTGRKG